MSETPILTYTDESLHRRQTLTLLPGKVHLKGNVFLKGEYEASFPLITISPDYQKVQMRDKSFWSFSTMLLVSGGITCVFVSIPGTNPTAFPGLLLTYMPLAFAIGCLMSFKKVVSAQFLTKQGQLLFSLVKGGKEKSRFEEVVSRLVTEIDNAKQPSDTAGPLNTTTATTP